MTTENDDKQSERTSREERIEILGERAVDHTEWWSDESGRVDDVVRQIVGAVSDRDDVQLAKRGASVSRTGEHTASFELRIAGEPWEYHDEDAEETVHKCGGCERVYGDPHVIDKGPRKAEVCPHCGTNVQNEDTEVRAVVF